MGLLKAYFGEVQLPIKITKLDRNLTTALNHETKRMGNADGVEITSSVYDSKIIEIEYLIDNYTAADLRNFRRGMAHIISGKEKKQLIFSDELDKYYDAVLTGETPLEESHMRSTGTLSFLVPDGIAHSVDEKEFKAKLNASGVLEATIYNDGTAAVPIDYTIHNNHDNGYIGVVTPDTVLQIGRIAEVDEVPYQQSEILINTNDFSNWERDTSVHPENPEKKTNGTLGMTTWRGTPVLKLLDRGANQGVNGGMVSMEIPPDSEGEQGAKNFWCYFNIWFETGAVKQVSTMSVNFLDENDELIFCYMVEKNELNSNKAHVMLRSGKQNKKYFDEYFEPSMAEYGRNMFDWPRGHADVAKMGSTIGGYYFGTRYNVNIPGIEAMVCHKIQLYIGGYDKLDMVTGSVFRSLTFQKHNVNKWEDVPNRFPQGSVIEVDGHAGKVYTDGILRPDDEVRGSDYPLAPPGESKVQFYYSDFSDPAPDITAKIREGWL